MITANRPSRITIIFWSVAATLSVARGFVNSQQPDRSIDLHAVYSWLKAWSWQGVNPYHPPAGVIENSPWWTMQANYPPYAIAFLSPITLIPEGWVTLLWSLFNLALTIVVVLLAFRIFNPDEPLKGALLLCLIFLSWVGVRVGLSNGQFSLLMLCFGLLTVAIADKRPYLGGVLLGFSLIKPHVGVAFFIWAVVTRRFKPAAVAVAVTVVGVLIFSMRLGKGPIFAIQEFVGVLRAQFGGEAYHPGVFELRPLVHFVVRNFFVGEIVHLALVLGLAGIIALVALNKDRLDGKQRDLLLLQLCCLWGLMAVFHYPYDSILMLPVMLGLYTYAARAPSPSSRRHARLAFWVLQAALVVEVAGRWRTVSKYFDLSGYQWLEAFISHFDRVLVLGFFMFIAYAAGFSRLITRKSPKLGELSTVRSTEYGVRSTEC